MSLYGTPPGDPAPEDLAPAVPVAPTGPVCAACGSDRLEQGFIEDAGESSPGFARWIPGALERGLFGGARRVGRQRFEIVALACQGCRFLNLSVGGPA